MKSEIAQIKIGIRNLENELLKLRKAIETGIYDSRSLVGDSVLMMEISVNKIKEATANLETQKGET